MGALDGKVAAITGATSGSGLAIARRFAAEGAQVVALARGRERLDALASAQERTVPIVTDIGDSASVRDAFAAIGERFGTLDILVNNAAVYRPSAVEQLDDDDVARQVATNLLGPVYTCRAAIPLLRASGGGDIVNTSSEVTLLSMPLLAVYAATKAGLEAFARVLAQEVRDDDIRVTTVVQGGTQLAEGGGSTDWEWDTETTTAALELWGAKGLLSDVYGRHGGQGVDDVAEVHLFIVTRPRSQKLDTVFCRSF